MDYTIIITEHELPTQKGEFKITLSPNHTILGVAVKDGKSVLVVQEKVSSSKKESSFQLFETNEEVDVDDDKSYLATCLSGGKLLHLFGRKISKSGNLPI